MFLGIIGKNHIADIRERFDAISQYKYLGNDFYGCLYQPESDNYIYWEVPDKGGLVILEGRIYDLAGQGPCAAGRELWDLYKKDKTGFLKKINGDYSLVIRDEEAGTTLLARDKIGAGRLYYFEENGSLVFGSKLSAVAGCRKMKTELNSTALLKYLMFCYNPDLETVYASVFKLRPAFCLQNKGGHNKVSQYWRLHFDLQSPRSEQQVGDEVRQQLTSAVQKRVDTAARTGAFLSGGLDSSSIVSLLHAEGKHNLKTFSFRCKGESFDESPFAEKVATTFGTDHHLIEYGPEEVVQADEMAGLMEEPFCDVGINVATYLLSSAAKGKVDEIFTGDGGDELFAGHPVYTADKIAKMIDWIPSFMLAPVFALGRQLKDSDKKKDLRVKIKRFSESFSYPKKLGTHRWRVYYQPSQMIGLLNPEFIEGAVIDNHLFDDLIAYNIESGESDPLARSLYSDYQTAVQFYLRRLDMAKSMGINPRFPMLDPDISEYCAGIPSKLKLPGMTDVKYIEKIAVDPLLPHEVVHRKDKLGHSIPMKNWMRDNDTVIEFMRDVLSKSALEKRSIFNPQAVERMIDDHQKSVMNNSHRIWALMILELWLQKHEDSD